MEKNSGDFEEMQAVEHRLNNIIMQKQSFQIEFSETQSALGEIENSKGDVFKVVGQMMVKSDREKLKNELLSKEKILDVKIKSIEKQETSLMDRLEKLRNNILNSAKK